MKYNFSQEKVILRLYFNPGLASTGFWTTLSWVEREHNWPWGSTGVDPEIPESENLHEITFDTIVVDNKCCRGKPLGGTGAILPSLENVSNCNLKNTISSIPDAWKMLLKAKKQSRDNNEWDSNLKYYKTIDS